MDFFVDGEKVVPGESSSTINDDAPYGVGLGIAAAVWMSVVFVSAMTFHIWLLLAVAVVLPIILGVQFGRKRGLMAVEDRKQLAAIISPPDKIALTNPDPILVWAIRVHQEMTEPGVSYIVSYETLQKWFEKKRFDLNLVQGALIETLYQKAKLTKGNDLIDVAPYRKLLPQVAKSIEEQHRRDRQIALDRSVLHWYKSWGDAGYSVARAILDDATISLAFDQVQRIEENAAREHYKIDEQEFKRHAEMRAVDRVQAIYDGAEALIKIEAESAHEAVIAINAVLQEMP